MVIWDDHEEGEKGLPDYKQVIVGWLSFKGGGRCRRPLEEAGDCVSFYDGWQFLSLLAN